MLLKNHHKNTAVWCVALAPSSECLLFGCVLGLQPAAAATLIVAAAIRNTAGEGGICMCFLTSSFLEFYMAYFMAAGVSHCLGKSAAVFWLTPYSTSLAVKTSLAGKYGYVGSRPLPTGLHQHCTPRADASQTQKRHNLVEGRLHMQPYPGSA